MRRIGYGVLPLFLVIAAAAPIRAQAVATTFDQPVIIAQGDSVLMLPPDRAYVQIAAEGRAAKIPDAQRLAATAMASVQAAVKATGLPADAIRTTSYVVQPEYDFNGGRQSFRDFLSRNVIEVRVDELARLADIIDAAGASGAASVTSLRFDLKNRGASELDALRRAVRDATERAQAIADGAGKTVGAVLRLQEQRSSSASPVFRMDAGGGGGGGGRGGAGLSTPIEPGEIQVRAQVTLTVAIR